MAKAYLKKWLVKCTECDGGIVDSKGKPKECPNDPTHAIEKVEKVGAFPTGYILTSPNGKKWEVYVADNGQLRTQEVK